MRSLALALLFSCAVSAEVSVQVEGVWFEADAQGGAVHYQVRTNLPERAVLELTLESRFDSVAGPEVRTVCTGRATIENGACKGTFDPLAAPLAPGRYLFGAQLAEGQRATVREALGDQKLAPIAQEVFLGTPAQIAASARTEAGQIAKDLATLEGVAGELDQWVAAYKGGKLAARAGEFLAWKEEKKKQIIEIMERASPYRQTYPTRFPESFAQIVDLGMNLRDHMSELASTTEEGSADIKDAPRTPEQMNLRLIQYLLRGLRFRFAWEVCYLVADVPTEIARAAAPEVGLPARAQWDRLKADLEQAIRDLDPLARYADIQVKEPVIRVTGVEAALAAETSDTPRADLLVKRAVAAKQVQDSGEVSKSLAALLKALDAGVKAEASPLPAPLKQQRDEFLAEHTKLCTDLQAAYR